jgi:DNA-binding LytR/AlgR family response regulator
MFYTCLIVDDEPIAAEIIEGYVRRLDHFTVAGVYHNAIQAFQHLQRATVDLLFLDIQMPRLSGLELLRALPRPPAVILTTAYRDFALEGFELDVIDYLLKPVAFERFLQAVAKFHARRASAADRQSLPPDPAQPAQPAHLFVRADRRMVRINLDDILYLESAGDYVKIVTPAETVLTKEPLTHFEERLPSGQFLRIHRSFVVNRSHIAAFSAHEAVVGGMEIPVGRKYKEWFLREMGR